MRVKEMQISDSLAVLVESMRDDPLGFLKMNLIKLMTLGLVKESRLPVEARGRVAQEDVRGGSAPLDGSSFQIKERQD